MSVGLWSFYLADSKFAWFYQQTSPKGVSASKCDVGNWIFSKSFLDFFGKFLEIFLELFGGFFWRNFLKEFFGRNFLGGILTFLKSAKLFEY